MPQASPEFDLHCHTCGWITVCAPPQITDWLVRHRLVKPNSDVDIELLVELFRTSAGKFACPNCGQAGLVASASEPLDDEVWGQSRQCESCGSPIPPERVEVFPDTRVCVACQNREEWGELTRPAEYCPRCGSIMELLQSRGSGITRYVMTCRACGSRRPM